MTYKLLFCLVHLSFYINTYSSSDPAGNQLPQYKKNHVGGGKIVTGYGVPVDNIAATLTAGYQGPVLLQDAIFLDTQAHFNRERIPERVVHAKGAGAFGYFQVTHNITQFTKALVFAEIGKKTPIAVRFSFVTGESGSSDTYRDPRGFPIKFYTEDGIWDLVGNNTPIFFIRDPILFPLFIHSQKRNPATHLRDANMFWDFISLRPETTHQVMFSFSDRGIPDGYRHMHGFGSHTFKMVNKNNEAVYVKFHYKTDQGIKNLSPAKAANISGIDPDYATRDLYNVIAGGDFPTWTLYIQVMTFKEAEHFHWNPFDLTKVWPHKEYPLIPVGKIILNRNPSNYFAEVEQIGFDPARMIPGIEPSPDKMLQGRLFTYSDTQRHRLGANFLQIPINSPFKTHVKNYQRDGPQTYTYNQGGAPNYYPNSFGGPTNVPYAALSKYNVTGDVARYNSGDEDNFSQPTLFWTKVLKPDERERLAQNIVNSLKAACDKIQVGGGKIVTGYGVPVDNIAAIQTAGYKGPALLQDTIFLDEQAHFDREKIPERVVHAKGAGAFGYFEVTHDITEYTKAIVFAKIGKKTPIAVRFSIVSGESGSSDNVRAVRGYAIKFYSEDGNWDLTGNNSPIFFIRDPMLFSQRIHSAKRNPVTHLQDANMIWDFFSLRPETTHQVLMLYSDRGIPDGYRHMDGFGVNTFKMVNKYNEAVYVKFHYKTDQGIKNLSPAEAANISGIDPDYAIRDLYNAIAEGNFPTWTFYIQVMTFKQAEHFRWNPFDVTKVWPHKEFPLNPVGKIVLNRNPSNFFAEVEQIGFDPARMIPGIESSPDKILQGRLFAYGDTQRYRLGPNFLQIPVNRPFKRHVKNYQRDGPQTYTCNQGGAPNYYPNSFGGPENVPSAAISRYNVTGDVARYNSGDEDNFSQAILFWNKVLKPDERKRLAQNIAKSLKPACDKIKKRSVKMLSNVDQELSYLISKDLSEEAT